MGARSVGPRGSVSGATRCRPRQATVAGSLALLLGLLSGALAGCSGDDDGKKDQPSSSASRASGATEASMVTTIGKVSGGRLGDARRLQTKKDVDTVIDHFLEGAYLGTFPRTDYTAAFADFTPRAAELATKQLAVLSNQSISDRITRATATNRRVRLTVFAPHGLARGITARFVLDFTTTGDLKEDQRVLGQLYLTKPKGASWQVFGFRVDQAVTR